MPWHRFVLFNALGAALWVTTWTSLGYLAGNHVESISRDITYFAIGAGVLVVLYLAWHLRRRRRRKRSAA
jgi:membrane protein DedA with SNARE-associated domain